MIGVSNSYVCGLGVLSFGGEFSYVIGVINSYVWGLDFLRLRVKDFYVWGLVILTFAG